MTFQIIEILESQSEDVLAKVLHQDNRMTATLRGIKDKGLFIEQSFHAEIGFDEILDWKVLSDFEDYRSGIWQGQDGIHLLGRIHSILDYGDGRIVIEVYLQNGPEFFTVNLDATENTVLEANDGLEIIVKTLFLFPGP